MQRENRCITRLKAVQMRPITKCLWKVEENGGDEEERREEKEEGNRRTRARAEDRMAGVMVPSSGSYKTKETASLRISLLGTRPPRCCVRCHLVSDLDGTKEKQEAGVDPQPLGFQHQPEFQRSKCVFGEERHWLLHQSVN